MNGRSLESRMKYCSGRVRKELLRRIPPPAPWGRDIIEAPAVAVQLIPSPSASTRHAAAGCWAPRHSYPARSAALYFRPTSLYHSSALHTATPPQSNSGPGHARPQAAAQIFPASNTRRKRRNYRRAQASISRPKPPAPTIISCGSAHMWPLPAIPPARRRSCAQCRATVRTVALRASAERLLRSLRFETRQPVQRIGTCWNNRTKHEEIGGTPVEYKKWERM